MLRRAAVLTLAATIVVVVAQHPNDDLAKANEHFERGNEAYNAEDLNRAVSEFEACLSVDHTDPRLRGVRQGCIVNLGGALFELGEHEDLPRAESLYRQALLVDPSDGDAAFNLALVLEELKTEGGTKEAAELYKIAVTANPSLWDAWANLAATLSELKEEPLRAIYAYERAILLINEPIEGDENPASDARLSELYYGYGMALSELTPEACAALALALASEPKSLLIDGEREAADDSAGGGVCAESAQFAMRMAAGLDPRNVKAAHMVAAMMAGSEGGGGEGSSRVRRASPEFVAALFDDFADTYNEKLGALGHKVPRLIGAAAAQERANRGKPYRSALDAGCGTGLAGRYLRHLVDGPMIGVDISQKMLDIAAKCRTPAGCGADEKAEGEEAKNAPPLYDGLIPLDLETMTLEQTLGAPDDTRRGTSNGGSEAFDLIVAADVLVYFGKLEALLGNFAHLSEVGSSLIFSCERATSDEAPQGWRLRPSGRFAHTKIYVVEVAAGVGYELVGYEEIVPRMEKGVEVQGHLFRFVLRGGASKDEL